MTRFDLRAGTSGLGHAGYQSGDSAHLAPPVAIVGAATADEAIARAAFAAQRMMDAVDPLAWARWVTTPTEGAYALAVNLLVALDSLPREERARVLEALPERERLIDLLGDLPPLSARRG